jgi:hypothetical protein
MALFTHHSTAAELLLLHQDHERHFGIGLRGTAGPSCPTRRRDDRETRDWHRRRATQG